MTLLLRQHFVSAAFIFTREMQADALTVALPDGSPNGSMVRTYGTNQLFGGTRFDIG